MTQTNDIIPNYYIGLMSGTSLDGVDAVLVNFQSGSPVLVDSLVYPIPTKLKKKIQQTSSPLWQGCLADVGTLNCELGELFADASIALLQQAKIEAREVTAIGSHGQTLWHQPEKIHSFSMQLGDANIIAEKTGITTVADFRNRDIAASGQGAPLAPAFHHAVFSHPEKHRTILNLGGIANITVLPATTTHRPVSGYDTGPGNGLLDAWMTRHNPDKSYDKNGEWARSGKLITELLSKLLADPYFAQSPPKSTGKEYFNVLWLEEFLGNELINYQLEDIQCTLTELSAISIANSLTDCQELYICGGGIHNVYLQERLKHYASSVSIASTESLGVHPDWVEAIAFAWLAKQTIEKKPSNLPSVTGAIGPRILGGIYQA